MTNKLDRCGRGACRERGERDGAAGGGMSGDGFLERGSKIEMDVAAADGAADLRIHGAQVAMLVVRQGRVLLLLGQCMFDAVHDRALLGEQQGEDEQRFQEDGAQHAAHSNRRPFAFQAVRRTVRISRPFGILTLYGWRVRLRFAECLLSQYQSSANLLQSGRSRLIFNLDYPTMQNMRILFRQLHWHLIKGVLYG